MNFEESLQWLYGFQKFGMNLGLERISYIAKELGNPQQNYKSIHVGGTNGKGSVCKFIASILEKSGYTVGVYTSPHLQHLSERFVVGNEQITEDEVVSIVQKIKPVVNKMMDDDNGPTFFEVVTALAFQYFYDKKVDFAVVEVGLGGRFDATNIVEPVLTVITNVSLEHQHILGKTVKDIAFEKAGIIKTDVPVVTGATGDALTVINKAAKEKKAQVTIIKKESWKRTCTDMNGQKFSIDGALSNYVVNTSMLGEYQGENIAVAIAAIEQLQMNGTYIPDTSIEEGLSHTGNIGRMEIVSNEPFILLDGAHNETGMKFLVDSLKKDFDYDKLIVVLGILSDKDITSMLSSIAPLADVIVTTKSKNTRACDPSKLEGMIKKIGDTKEVTVKEQIPDAITYAKSIAKKQDLICVTGSLFTVGEARDCLLPTNI